MSWSVSVSYPFCEWFEGAARLISGDCLDDVRGTGDVAGRSRQRDLVETDDPKEPRRRNLNISTLLNRKLF